MSPAETQVNPLLLDSSCSILDTIFQGYKFVEQLSNNSTELIGKRHQIGVLSVIRGTLRKHAKSGETDTTGLGRWKTL